MTRKENLTKTIKIRSEVLIMIRCYQRNMKYAVEEINKSKIWFFKSTDKTDKNLSELINKKEGVSPVA